MSRLIRSRGGGVSRLALVDSGVFGADKLEPTAPGNLTVSARTASSLTLTWDASTDNVGVVAYEVEFQLVGIGIYGWWETTTLLTSTITGLAEAQTYHVRVRAVDAAGNVSAWSTLLNESTADETAPTVPGNLAASSITSTTLTLTWDASTDNVDVTEYEVQQRLASGVNGDYVTIGTVAAPTVTLAVTGLAQDTGYRFRVRARDAASNVSAWGPDDTGLLATTLWPFVAPDFSASVLRGIFADGDDTGYFVISEGAATYTVTDVNGTHNFRGLCKLDRDGEFVTGFAPSFNGNVNFACVDTVNRWLYIVGTFTQVDSVTYNRVCRFGLDTLTIDSGWNPNSGALIHWVGLDNNRDVIVGYAASTTIGGQTRSRVARLSRTTGLADSWNPAPTGGTVWFGLVDSSDIILGGTFPDMGGLTRPAIARVSLSTGAADATFNANALTGLNRDVGGLAITNGSLYVAGGTAMSFNATTRVGFAKLSPTTGAIDTGFNASPSGGSAAGVDVLGYGNNIIAVTGATNIGGGTSQRFNVLDGATGNQASPQVNYAGSVPSIFQGHMQTLIRGNKLLAVTVGTAAGMSGTSLLSAGDYCLALQLP